MASGFSGEASQCEGLPGCKAVDGVEYYVQEKKTLCKQCATKTGCARKAKKDELGLFCEKHDKPVRLYCKHHDIVVCQLCGMIDHKRHSCELQDVEDAIAVKKHELNNLQKTSKDKVSSWKKFEVRLGRCAVEAKEELKSIKERVNSVINEETSMITKKEQNEILEINQEADAEIQKINEKRKARLDECQEDAEKHRQLIESRRCGLIDDVTAIAVKIQTYMADLQHDARDVIKAIDEAAETMEILLEDNRKLLEGTQEFVTSLTDTLGKAADEGVVEHIEHIAKSVNFIEGVGNEKYNGRIAGYEGTWELSSTVVVGCASNDEIIISDMKEHTYCLNLRNKKSKRVLLRDDISSIKLCAHLEDTIVCCKSFRGYISLYNRKWKLFRNIRIPQFSSPSSVCVAVDRDGMIVAANHNQRYIYVINPEDGSIVNKIKCKENIELVPDVLSTSDVIALPVPPCNKLLIIDRQGAQREITHSKRINNCFIDPLTDDLYVVHQPGEGRLAVIDQLSGEGSLQKIELARFHAEWNLALFGILIGRNPLMTKAGEIIVCTGRQCLIFKKSFAV